MRRAADQMNRAQVLQPSSLRLNAPEGLHSKLHWRRIARLPSSTRLLFCLRVFLAHDRTLSLKAMSISNRRQNRSEEAVVISHIANRVLAPEDLWLHLFSLLVGQSVLPCTNSSADPPSLRGSLFGKVARLGRKGEEERQRARRKLTKPERRCSRTRGKDEASFVEHDCRPECPRRGS